MPRLTLIFFVLVTNGFAIDLKITDTTNTVIVLHDPSIDYGGLMGDKEMDGIRLYQGEAVVTAKWTNIRMVSITGKDASPTPRLKAEVVPKKGNRISTTLVNKGLEVIEAHLLFGIGFADIEVVVHRQSVVHSMVEFTDGSTIAQASPPDMRIPIALALAWPDRVPEAASPVDWRHAHAWTFEPLDEKAFPAVSLAREVGAAGGTAPAVYNAANEVAVAAFLDGRLPFLIVRGRLGGSAEQRGQTQPAVGRHHGQHPPAGHEDAGQLLDRGCPGADGWSCRQPAHRPRHCQTARIHHRCHDRTGPR